MGPKSRTLIWHSNFGDDNSRHEQVIERHPFNSQVQVFFPTSPGQVAERLQYLRTMEMFYYKVQASWQELLHPKFIETYITSRKFYALSINAWIDADPVVAILPSGMLVLSLPETTYRKFGTVGKNVSKSWIGRNETTSPRYRITQDLCSPLFRPGSPSYDRFIVSAQRLLGSLEIVVCAADQDNHFSTVQFESEYKRVDCPCELNEFSEIETPIMEQLEIERIGQIYDWIGTVACQCCYKVDEEPFVSTFKSSFDIPTAILDKAFSMRWRGFISDFVVRSTIDAARNAVAKNEVPFAVVMVWGFDDSPCSWTSNANPSGLHDFSICGCNDYALVILPNDEYWMLQTIGTLDCTV